MLAITLVVATLPEMIRCYVKLEASLWLSWALQAGGAGSFPERNTCYRVCKDVLQYTACFLGIDVYMSVVF